MACIGRSTATLILALALLPAGMNFTGQSTHRSAYAAQIRPAAAPQPPTEDDLTFLDGLRKRRLFRLAEQHIQQALAQGPRSVGVEGEWIMEWSRTLAAQAVETPPVESGPVWNRAAAVVDDFARKHPADDPRTLLPRVQKALVLLAHGELLLRQAEASGDDPALLEPSRAVLRQAIELLAQCAEQAAQWQRPNMASRLPPDAPTAAELFALETNLDYQLTRAYRCQGAGYPAASPDRSAALLKAVERLALLAQRPVEEATTWPAKLDEIACYRLLEDFHRAAQRLDQLDQLKPPADVALAARAERIRLSVDARQIEAAMQLVGQGRAVDGRTSPDLDFAVLEALLAAARAADVQKNTPAAEAHREQAAKVVRFIRQTHSPYWGRRAEALESRHALGAVGGTVNLTALVRAAENFYRNGQFADAVKTFDDVRRQAMAANDRNQAFDAGFTAAAIVYQQNQPSDAARRFLELSQDAQHPKAPRAHLAAVGAALETAKQKEPLDLAPYAALLDEHLKRWPNSPGAGEVRWRLGELHEMRRQWADAVRAFAEIPLGDPRYAAGMASLVRCYQAYLAELQSQGQAQQAAELAGQAAEWFQRTVLGDRRMWPERWSPDQRQAALSAAQFWMHPGLERYDHAETILRAALSDPAGADPAWLADARRRLVVALAGAQKTDEALKLLQDLSAPGAASTGLLDLLSGLSRVSETASPDLKTRLASLQLQAASQLEPRRSTLSPSDSKLLDLTYARALSLSGRPSDARAKYETLLKLHPRDGDLAEEHALLLVSSTDRSWLTSSLSSWRDLERKSKPGSPRWFRSRYYQALSHTRLGNPSASTQLITITRTLHPTLGGPTLKPLFDQLSPP